MSKKNARKKAKEPTSPCHCGSGKMLKDCCAKKRPETAKAKRNLPGYILDDAKSVDGSTPSEVADAVVSAKRQDELAEKENWQELTLSLKAYTTLASPVLHAWVGPTKTCRNCHEEKPESAFEADRHNGLTSSLKYTALTPELRALLDKHLSSSCGDLTYPYSNVCTDCKRVVAGFGSILRTAVQRLVDAAELDPSSSKIRKNLRKLREIAEQVQGHPLVKYFEIP